MDRYQKIKKIGEGSFGKAYLVKSKRDGQQYVIKEINIVRMSKKEREEARKEVALLAQMKHPNIVTYRESFEETGSLYICMDFCDAGDLYAKINAQRGILFNEDQVIDWFVQICFSIKYIHDRKILHRDIKSQNIFLTKNGTIKLGDFGIAKVLNSTVELARTCIGTPYYLSPEICENRPYNNKSDIWSLGCVLYEITTLKHAFEAGNMKNLVFKIVRGSYPPVSAKYSYDLRNVIAALFKRNPRDRPSVNNLLRKNFLVKKVERFMGNEVIAKEFGHTVMHGQKMAKDIRAIPPSPAPVSRPVSARSVQEKRPESAKPTPRYDPAAIYGAPAARRSKENVARKSRESSRKSADADKKRAAIAAVAVANNDMVKKKRELLEKERIRRAQQKDKEFAAQHKAIMDKQKVARIHKAREEGWKGMMESISSNEDEKSSSSDSRPKTPQQANRNIPSPKPVGGAPHQRMPVNDRGQYDHYNDFIDKLAVERAECQRAPQKNYMYMDAGQGPQIAARQANQDQQLGAKAAERARVVEEYMNRKKEAAYYKARGNQMRGVQRPDSARGGAGDNRPKKEWADIDAKNNEEKEYLSRLKQIRLQNFNERRNVQQVDKPGVGVKGALNNDADQRKKKIEALKAQADEQAKKLKEQLELKRRAAYEKEKQALKWDRGFEQRPLFPVEPPKRGEQAPVISITQAMAAIGGKKEESSSGEKVEPAPVISITQVMAAIGAKKDVETSFDKSPLQKKKDEELRRVNDKPRSKWGNGEEKVPILDLANFDLEETASGMEVTSVRDSVVKGGGEVKRKEERKKWGEPDPDVLPSARRQWGGMHESLLNKLSEADIQATVTLSKKEDEGATAAGGTIVITTQPPTPKAHGTITLSKDDTKPKDSAVEEKGIDSSMLVPEVSGPKIAGTTITISDKQERVRPVPRPRSRSPSPQPRQLPELKPRNAKSDSQIQNSDSDDATKVGEKAEPTKRSKSQLSCLKALSDKKTERDEVNALTEGESKAEDTVDSVANVKPDIPTKPKIAAKPEIATKPSIPAKPDIAAKPVIVSSDGSQEETKPDLPAKPVINARTVNLEVKKEIEERADRMPQGEEVEPGKSDSALSTEEPRKEENVPPKDAWDLETPASPEPSPEKPSTQLKQSLKKESPLKGDEKAPTEVNTSQGGKLFDKVELEEEDDKAMDDMKVEEYEDEESNPSYLKTITGMKLGLTIGNYDLRDSKMLRTCSLPDLSKLFKTMEGSPEVSNVDVRYSLDLPCSPSSQNDEENDDDDDGEENENENEENEGSDRDSDYDDDEVDEDLADVMATMESLLLDRQDSNNDAIDGEEDLKGSGSDSGDDADRDSATTTGSSFISTIVPGKEDWCSDDDDEDGDHEVEDDMFCRLEESRAQLEGELGCDRFLDVYKSVQAAHEDEDENIVDGEKIALGILGDKGHLYNKILQLVMADGAYIEDND